MLWKDPYLSDRDYHTFPQDSFGCGKACLTKNTVLSTICPFPFLWKDFVRTYWSSLRLLASAKRLNPEKLLSNTGKFELSPRSFLLAPGKLLQFQPYIFKESFETSTWRFICGTAPSVLECIQKVEAAKSAWRRVILPAILWFFLTTDVWLPWLPWKVKVD